MEGYWKKPQTLVRYGHFNMIPSFNLEGDRIRVAFTEDGRSTGYCDRGGAEWADDESEIAVGVVEVEFTGNSRRKNEFHEFHLKPLITSSIAEPYRRKRSVNEYICALGQLHTHSSISVCWRQVDKDIPFNYRFMQDVQHCQFGAVTDHSYNMWHIEMLWVRKMAEYYYFPGKFIAIPSYEWTGTPVSDVSHEGGPFGHFNPLYLEEDGDLEFYSPMDPESPGGSAPRFMKTCENLKILAFPHHIKDGHWFNWKFYNGDIQPVVEIFQEFRGSCESRGAPGSNNSFQVDESSYAVEKLQEGLRFGFIAGADHAGLALAGVLLKKLTRGALYDALKERRCFGTTGINPIIDFTCNKKPMGTFVSGDMLDFILKVISPCGKISSIDIVRNGIKVEKRLVNKNNIIGSWSEANMHKGEFIYCRIMFVNGEIAWTSPIWLD
jgi:hypothetical protein